MTSIVNYVPDLDVSPLVRALGQFQIAIHAMATAPEGALIRDARNETVHGYREEKAREIAAMAEPLLAEALVLLENLKRRTESDGSTHEY